ncbi:hypothetical protein C8E87_5581 [Paractinoplanes brasiliensis]|uniref:Uncharacterized protein n=1 Tax=Paractinoplanes brasiliensis TaxID=52695 RepID=A0A4R6K0Q7_9ACTN|nr:hypothetical protein C8E87_5581 [Actinoplanes brasiliensis]
MRKITRTARYREQPLGRDLRSDRLRARLRKRCSSSSAGSLLRVRSDGRRWARWPGRRQVKSWSRSSATRRPGDSLRSVVGVTLCSCMTRRWWRIMSCSVGPPVRPLARSPTPPRAPVEPAGGHGPLDRGTWRHHGWPPGDRWSPRPAPRPRPPVPPSRQDDGRTAEPARSRYGAAPVGKNRPLTEDAPPRGSSHQPQRASSWPGHGQRRSGRAWATRRLVGLANGGVLRSADERNPG